MFLTPMSRRVSENHGLGTSSVASRGKSGPLYLTTPFKWIGQTTVISKAHFRVAELEPGDAFTFVCSKFYIYIYVSFSEFIQYFSSNISRNQHWRQYEKICHPCVINYDFIGHFETMGAVGPVVLKMAGIDDRVTFRQFTKQPALMKCWSTIPRFLLGISSSWASSTAMTLKCLVTSILVLLTLFRLGGGGAFRTPPPAKSW